MYSHSQEKKNPQGSQHKADAQHTKFQPNFLHFGKMNKQLNTGF